MNSCYRWSTLRPTAQSDSWVTNARNDKAYPVSQSVAHVSDPSFNPTRIDQFTECRQRSLDLCSGLSVEDHMLQGAPFASPPKWHLAHTTWFFVTFLLEPRGAAPHAPAIWQTLFNSYYNGIGQPHNRHERGLLSRPALTDVMSWRTAVDDALVALLERDGFGSHELALLELGMQHEMQHQELLMTDLLYSLSRNPALPAYADGQGPLPMPTQPRGWHRFDGGLVDIGATGEGFAFDNELPRYPHHLQPFELADRLVTNREYQAFVDAGGYHDPQWWLLEGWERVQQEQWQDPLHWLAAGEGTIAAKASLWLARPTSAHGRRSGLSPLGLRG